MMTPTLYQQKRDELAALLDHCSRTLVDLARKHEILRDPVIERHSGALQRIRAKIYEDQFRIALISKFQGGKSTTFNALAGGLPLSPMGGGAIRTSACVCRVWNVTDPDRRGTTILWRSDEELLLAVMDLLRDQFTRIDADRFLGKDVAAIARELKLADRPDRELLAKAVRAEVAEYKANRGLYTSRDCVVPGGSIPVSGPDKLNLLFMAVVISRYYGNSQIEQLKQEQFTSENVGDLLRFPNRFTTRMADFFDEVLAEPRDHKCSTESRAPGCARGHPRYGARDSVEQTSASASDGKEVFSPRELAFAFIREVQIRIESANLARIGAAIADCPGLSASAYDTRVAMDVIGKSHAVWYLLDGGRAIGDAELQDIADAHKAAAGKMFFTVNLKSDVNPAREFIVREIIPHLTAQLEQLGIRATLHPYHALLAYLAMTGPELLCGKASKAAMAVLEEKAKDMCITASTPVEAWAMVAEDLLHRLKVPAKQRFVAMNEKLSDDGIGLVRGASGLDDILAQVEGYVVENKAICILVNDGIDRAIGAVKDGIEKPLQAREKDAELHEDECRKKYDAMEKRVEAFCKDSQVILGLLKSTDVDRELAMDFLDTVVMPAIPDVAAIAAPAAVKQMSLLKVICKDKEKRDKEMQAILGSALAKGMEPFAQRWLEEVKTGQKHAFKGFLRIVEECRQRLLRDWDTQVKQMPDLDTLPEPTAVFGGRDNKVSTVFIDLEAQIRQRVAVETGVDLAAGALGGWALFGSIAFFTPGIGPIFTIISVAICALVWTIVQSSEAFTTKVCSRIRQTMIKEVSTRRAEIIDTVAKQRMSLLRKAYRSLFGKGLKSLKQELERRRQQAEADHRASQEVRLLLAKECRHIRTVHITPLREKLEAYRNEIIPLLPDANRGAAPAE